MPFIIMIVTITAFLFVFVRYWKSKPPRRAVVRLQRQAPHGPGESCPWDGGDSHRRGARQP
jgi:hypothetical protein